MVIGPESLWNKEAREYIYFFIKNMEDDMVWILGYKHERQKRH